MNHLTPLALLAAVALPLHAEPICYKPGDRVELDGVVAERRVDPSGDGKEVHVYVFRTHDPVCILGSEAAGMGGKRSSNRFQLSAAPDSLYHNALASVSGGYVRITGVLGSGQRSVRVVAADMVSVDQLTDLEAAGGPAPVEPDVPVAVTFRNALLSGGKVARFRNTSPSQLAFTIDIVRASTDRRLNKDLVLDAGDTRELGEREGWSFAQGDEITLSRKGLKSVTIIAP